MNRNIRWATIKRTSNDKGPYKTVTVECDGAEYELMALDLGGVQSAPVEGGQVLMFLADGDEGKAAGIVMPPPADRVDQQKPGETTIKNWTRGQTIKLDDNGDVVIKTPGIVHINPPE
jgi:phage gp45-like